MKVDEIINDFKLIEIWEVRWEVVLILDLFWDLVWLGLNWLIIYVWDGVMKLFKLFIFKVVENFFDIVCFWLNWGNDERGGVIYDVKYLN